MIFSLKKAFLIWLLWATTFTLGTFVLITISESNNPDFKVYPSEFLLILGVITIPTLWLPFLATKKKQSAKFFIWALVGITLSLCVSTFVVNGVFWLLSNGVWNPDAVDAGFGAAMGLFYYYIVILIATAVAGVITRIRAH